MSYFIIVLTFIMVTVLFVGTILSVDGNSTKSKLIGKYILEVFAYSILYIVAIGIFGYIIWSTLTVFELLQ